MNAKKFTARTPEHNSAMLDKMCQILPKDVVRQLTQREMADALNEPISYVQTALVALQYVGAIQHKTEFLAGKGTRSLWMRVVERDLIDAMFLAQGVKLTENWGRKAAKEMGGHARKSPHFQPSNPAWKLQQEIKPIAPKATFELASSVLSDMDDSLHRDAIRLVDRAEVYADAKKKLQDAAAELNRIGVHVEYTVSPNSQLDTVVSLFPLLTPKMPMPAVPKAKLVNGKSAAVKYVAELNTKSHS